MIKLTFSKELGMALRTQGFTLIELSIVLVIIGLIVGGVLVGRDLIEAAKIRSAVSQVEKYNAAANTFRSKYNGIPGDVKNGATFFAITDCGSSPAGVGCGDGNGIIEPSTDTGGFSGESVVFWGMLTAAKLTTDETNILDYSNTATSTNLNTSMPLAKVGRKARVMVMSQNGFNYFMLGFTNNTLDAASVAAALTPLESSQIDTKLDDGAANTGTVKGIDAADAMGGSSFTPADYVQGTCATGGNVYDIAANPKLVACALGIRASF